MPRSLGVLRTARALWTKGALVISLSMLGAAAPAMADAVTDWNAFVDSLPGQPPPIRARVQAAMQVAVHDALNSIEPRFESYSKLPRARRTAHPDAAVAAASRAVLVGLMSTQEPAITAFYNAAMASCSTQACLDGIAAGEAAANAILLARNGDGSATCDVGSVEAQQPPARPRKGRRRREGRACA